MGCAQQNLIAFTTSNVQPASAKGSHGAGMGGPCQGCHAQAAMSLLKLQSGNATTTCCAHQLGTHGHSEVHQEHSVQATLGEPCGRKSGPCGSL